jgi:hypothetical protein
MTTEHFKRFPAGLRRRIRQEKCTLRKTLPLSPGRDTVSIRQREDVWDIVTTILEEKHPGFVGEFSGYTAAFGEFFILKISPPHNRLSLSEEVKNFSECHPEIFQDLEVRRRVGPIFREIDNIISTKNLKNY